MTIELHINGSDKSVEIDPDTPLLWVLRDHLGLKGTKFGCGSGLCGSCTVHIDSVAVRSCVLPVKAAAAKNITTIEGLGGEHLDRIQRQWIKHNVPQCGYCQPGMIMAASALLNTNPNPDIEVIRRSITNLCRCGTYNRVLDAIAEASTTEEQS